MAKGDAIGGAMTGSSAQAPKMDQYSVMHTIMDKLGMGDSGIAPSQNPLGTMPRSPDQGQMSMNPNSNVFAGNTPPGYNPGMMGGRFQPMGQRMGSMNGITAGGSGSMAPTNPQDMIRRSMIGSGTYGQ